MMERARISSHTTKIEHEAVYSLFAETLIPFFKCYSSVPKAWLAGDGWDFPAESFCHLTSTVPVPHPRCAPVPAKEHPVLSFLCCPNPGSQVPPVRPSFPSHLWGPSTSLHPDVQPIAAQLYHPPSHTDCKVSCPPPLLKPWAQTQSIEDNLEVRSSPDANTFCTVVGTD